MCSSTSLLLIGDELIQLGGKCTANEQFHQANNKWDVTKNNNKIKQTNKQQVQQTHLYEQSLGNSQNKL